MSDKIITLTEATRDALLELLERSRRGPRNTQQRPNVPEHQWLPPEVYVAKTPAGGIPGFLESNTTGTAGGINSADCAIYQLVQGTLQQVASLTKTVYNLFTSPIQGDRWILVSRDKFGKWYSTTSEAGDPDPTPDPTIPDSPGGGPCVLARVKTTDCLEAVGPLNSVIMREGGGTWTGDHPIRYFDKSGIVTASYNTSTGFMDLFVDGLRLMNCGNGCYTGGPLTGHVPTAADTTGACKGKIFTVCLTCICCADPLWDGPGYYCVLIGTGTGTAGTACEPMYLTEADKCLVTICSGRYDTLAEAQAVCSGGSMPLPTNCYTPGTEPPSLSAQFTGGLASVGTVVCTFSGSNNLWLGSFTFCGLPFTVDILCDQPGTGLWSYIVGTVGSETCFVSGDGTSGPLVGGAGSGVITFGGTDCPCGTGPVAFDINVTV